MPTYTYDCNSCGKIWYDKKMEESDLEKCPYCGASVKRIYSTGGVLWKCDGSYSKVNS